jgi:hypothetical protein
LQPRFSHDVEADIRPNLNTAADECGWPLAVSFPEIGSYRFGQHYARFFCGTTGVGGGTVSAIADRSAMDAAQTAVGATRQLAGRGVGGCDLPDGCGAWREKRYNQARPERYKRSDNGSALWTARCLLGTLMGNGGWLPVARSN